MKVVFITFFQALKQNFSLRAPSRHAFFQYTFCFTGTFGQVLECWDREAKEMVAIKVVRSIKKYREAAMMEIDVLQLLGRYDKSGSWLV